MSKIIDLLNSLDIAALLPDLNSLLNILSALVILLVMLGPLLLLGLGLFYLFAAPKEANHRLGFRTYFGMGSVQAWHFTQKIAGFAFGGLGIILTIVMGIICIGLMGKDLDQITGPALTCLIWEVALAAIDYLAVVLLVTVTYDQNGNRRK